MNRKLRKVLSGMSTAGLVMAGSIPLMGDDAKPGDKKVDTKQTQSVKSKTAPNVKDTVGKGDCGKGKVKTTKQAPAEKTTSKTAPNTK